MELFCVHIWNVWLKPWINIQYEQDTIDTILDDELVTLDAMDNSDPDLIYEFIEDYNEFEEGLSTIITEIKYTHLESVESMDLLQSYINSNNMQSNNKMALDKLLWNIQSHHLKNPKKAPSVASFFSPRK